MRCSDGRGRRAGARAGTGQEEERGQLCERDEGYEFGPTERQCETRHEGVFDVDVLENLVKREVTPTSLVVVWMDWMVGYWSSCLMYLIK